MKVCKWAAAEGHSYFGALKTSTKCTPYQELLDTMAEYPSGSNLVMECNTPNEHGMICIGYKYSASKVLVFLGTKSSGSTKPGEPYIARFPDANGNVAQRSVPRPDIISKYFNDSNVIDSHNQSRQFELALEKRWVTQDCFFRVDTTVIGMVVTDSWRAYKHALPTPAKKKELTIKEFAGRLAYDCINNCHSDTIGSNCYLPVDDKDSVPAAVGGRQSDVSAVTEAVAALSVAELMAEHSFKNNTEREQEGTGRPIRRHCRADGCTKTYHKKCFHPQCLKFKYKTSKGWVKGVFYCPDHYHVHYGEVLKADGNV
jgi:hypothetical protein